MLIEEAIKAMEDASGNDAYYSLRAAATVLLDDEFMHSRTPTESQRLLEKAIGLLCYRAAIRP